MNGSSSTPAGGQWVGQAIAGRSVGEVVVRSLSAVEYTSVGRVFHSRQLV